ncbi:TPA: hypothetical protein I7234_16085 [Vibrio vulnificus]|nr:hypothetical protein [Vibrio vulnificus]HAS6153225.1 hypothetical protein [Vibrio vulnificus]HAS6353730.1 hypothetical protein [Vibrio vulnificus]HAS6367577.1 hypothetical protein [Vibrio vulnificus]HDY7611437.1 hypothetical protein [Vibrio vulnificus]
MLQEAWPRVKHQLKPALKDYYLDAENAVKQGTEQVFRLGDTVMLLRGETLGDGSKELVVVALVGEMASGTLGALNHARSHGFDSIRAHFFRAGAERFIRDKLSLPVKEIERRGDERVLRIRFADMGGSSSSQSRQSNVTSTTNTSGSAAAGRDNHGVMLAGVNDSDINLTLTDHGAMAVAGNLAEEALDFGQQSLRANERVMTGSLNAVNSTVDEAFSFGTSALEETSAVSRHAMDSLKSMAGQQNATTKAAIAMASGAKSREQTGGRDSDNSLLKNVSLMVGILGTLMTMAYLFSGRKT